jgi:archaellum biogenesis protein FlaJ (TadC family)
VTKKEITSHLAATSYRLFGKITPRFAAFKQVYQQSGISRMYESYMAIMFFATLAAFVSAFTVGALLHHLFFSLAPFQYLTAVLTFSCVTSLAVPIFFISYPLYRRTKGKNEIEANLIYTTGYMGILSAGGISIERMFERVAEVEQHPSISALVRGLITNIKMFGYDVTTSIMQAAAHSPSETFSKLLISIMNTVKTSGDLKSLLAFETERLLHAKREQLKKTLGTLTVLGEIYITAMVLGPIVFIIMLTILSVMGNVSMGLSPPEQLNLIVFFGLPVMSAVIIVILNGVLPEEE